MKRFILLFISVFPCQAEKILVLNAENEDYILKGEYLRLQADAMPLGAPFLLDGSRHYKP